MFKATKFKLHFPIPPKKVKKTSRKSFSIEFSTKTVGLIILFVIFNNINVTSKLNETCPDVPILTIVNSLTNPT